MKQETKYLDKTEACYETEYALRKEIHYRKGEILKLECTNAKHCREIERLRFTFDEMDKSVGECLSRIEELEFELNIRNVPAMKESLKSSARLAIKQDDEIDRLNERISTILETTSDVPEIVRGDQIDHITECKDLFEYLKALLVVLSEKEGNESINPDDIDVKYIEAASRYCYPVLFDKYAILSEDGRHKIELADSILHKFGIGTMAKYEELVERGDIGIAILDNRVPYQPKGL